MHFREHCRQIQAWKRTLLLQGSHKVSDMTFQASSHAQVGKSVPSSNGSDTSDILDLQDDEGWEDVEPEDEQEQIISLLDQAVFSDVASMLSHCKDKLGFDFMRVRENFTLDFYGTIRLVNYIRSEVKAGRQISSTIIMEDFDHDRFLKPVLENDALLFCLDDLPDAGTTIELAVRRADSTVEGNPSKLIDRVKELEEELRRTQSQFSDYRDTVKQTLDDRWNDNPAGMSGSNRVVTDEKRDDDSHYFSSYSYNGMLFFHTLSVDIT
jgi:protein arginine N-methyltransferase 3